MKIGQMIDNATPVPMKGFDLALAKTVQYIDCLKSFNAQWDKLKWVVPLISDLDTTVGIEIEVENIKAVFPLPPFMAGKPDNSLRHGGMEYNTVPLHAKEMYQALVLLWIFFDKVNKGEKPSFSWRTSAHLHIDVNSLTKDQFQNFLLMGMIFERLLFAMSGEHRDQSVFCVPLRESTLLGPLTDFVKGKMSLKKLIGVWPKYTAMHLGRMIAHDNMGPGLGTVEFRHQSGTPNLEHLLIWITTIGRLYQYAEKTSAKDLMQHILTLNTDSHYSIFMKEVLSPALMMKFHVADFAKAFSQQVSAVKEIIGVVPEIKTSDKSSLGNIVKRDIKKKEEQYQKEQSVQLKLKNHCPNGWDLNQWKVNKLIFDDVFNEEGH